MKKLISILLINIIILGVSNSASAQGDIGIDNLRNFYTKKDFVDLKDVKDNDTPIANQLQFSNESYDLISESKDFNKFSNFKGKKLDVFGISYNGQCNTKYIYGGVTATNEYLDKSRNIPINIWINGNHKTISTNKVSTNKKFVAAREIDVKLRKYLQEEYNIYGHNGTKKGEEYGHKSKFYSGFNIGKVTFHLNNNDTFSYDLFYTGDDGLPKSFLKIYEDNKTVESEKFHLDVDISYKETI
ncbi:TPA: staphylococcal enterotoxin type K [Staphylococcus aureus]|nr:staphylococcal enterotoxin type K [Staphylococcus aureus]